MWPIGPTTAHLDELDVDAGYCPAGCTTAQHEDVALCPAFVMMRILLHGDIARPWAIACSDESCETVFCTSHGQLSEPQVNLKNNDGPEPKPPASNIFSILARPDFPTLVPVVVPGKIWDLRAAWRCRSGLVLGRTQGAGTSGRHTRPKFVRPTCGRKKSPVRPLNGRCLRH